MYFHAPPNTNKPPSLAWMPITIQDVVQRFIGPGGLLEHSGRQAMSRDNVRALVDKLEVFTSDEIAHEQAVQSAVDLLHITMTELDHQSDVYRRAHRRLQALCRYTDHLPESCYIAWESVDVDNTSWKQSAMSDIYRGIYDGQEVAIKVIRTRMDNMKEIQKTFSDEVILWTRLKHRNVTPFLGVLRCKDYCLLSKWMVNGTIVQYLEAHPQALRPALVLDILQGLQYIHSYDMSHGDLKGANVLVDENGTACLADFGLSTIIHSTLAFTCATNSRGTVRWMSPELHEGDSYKNPAGMSELQLRIAADVWAWGLVVWEIYTGRIPFHYIRQDSQVIFAVWQGARPERPNGLYAFAFTDGMWELLQLCWQAEPHSRPKLEEAVRHFQPGNKYALPDHHQVGHTLAGKAMPCRESSSASALATEAHATDHGEELSQMVEKDRAATANIVSKISDGRKRKVKYACRFCDATFVRSRMLRKHNLKSHPGKKFIQVPCPTCYRTPVRKHFGRHNKHSCPTAHCHRASGSTATS